MNTRWNEWANANTDRPTQAAAKDLIGLLGAEHISAACASRVPGDEENVAVVDLAVVTEHGVVAASYRFDSTRDEHTSAIGLIPWSEILRVSANGRSHDPERNVLRSATIFLRSGDEYALPLREGASQLTRDEAAVVGALLAGQGRSAT